MKYFFITCIVLLINTMGLIGQQVEDFESFGVTNSNPLVQAANGYAFESGIDLLLYNDYNEEWSSWSGFAISADTDVTTPGFLNQYSSIAGTGADGSQAYAVSFASPPATMARPNKGDQFIKGLAINNATYAYLSMLDGDSFAKKFGGVTGDDPDYFLLTIKGYWAGELLSDSLNHYLADYRFEDNSQDYIQRDWSTLDIFNSIGPADSLSFQLSSTDVGQFGMNTPAYFCVDNIEVGVVAKTLEHEVTPTVTVGPNPTTDIVTISVQQELEEVTLFDISGNVIFRSTEDSSTQTIDLSAYANGIYTILVSYEGKDYLQKVIKL